MSRTRLIWTLLVLSLSPGLVAAAFRDQWHGLPSAVQWTAYGLAAVLLVAACFLILRSDGAESGAQTSTRASPGDDA